MAVFTVLFNNMRTLKFKGRPTNAFFAAINQMFRGSSQLTTAAEHCFVVWTVHDLITACSAVVRSWEEPPSIRLTVAKNIFVGWALNFRLRIERRSKVFWAENHKHIEIKWVGTGKEWVAMGTEFCAAVGVFPVELLAYQVSMVTARFIYRK